jgi:hypothetical protein
MEQTAQADEAAREELDAVLGKLVKDGRVSIISRASWGSNRAVILLKRSG